MFTKMDSVHTPEFQKTFGVSLARDLTPYPMPRKLDSRPVGFEVDAQVQEQVPCGTSSGEAVDMDV